MRKQSAFLARQIARFGMMTADQLQKVCSGRCTRATVYRILNGHALAGLIDKPFIPTIPFKTITATRKLYSQVLPKHIERTSSVHERNALHALAVTEAFITLSRYSFVTMVATEHELDANFLKQFCYSKTPDGLIQISNGNETFELAVEVEWSQKNETLMNEFIDKYRATFMKEMICAGLLLVTKNQAMFDAYQGKIKELPTELEKRILVVKFDDLKTLDSRYFGTLMDHPGESLSRTATVSQGRISAEPLFYKDFCSV